MVLVGKPLWVLDFILLYMEALRLIRDIKDSLIHEQHSLQAITAVTSFIQALCSVEAGAVGGCMIRDEQAVRQTGPTATSLLPFFRRDVCVFSQPTLTYLVSQLMACTRSVRHNQPKHLAHLSQRT